MLTIKPKKRKDLVEDPALSRGGIVCSDRKKRRLDEDDSGDRERKTEKEMLAMVMERE
jgi:hypothetical protein